MNPQIQPTTGTQRLLAVFFRHGEKSIREQADIMLFMAGLAVEYVLLFALFNHYARIAPTGLTKSVAYIVMGALFFALAIHQFLIFRNYSLHDSLSQNPLRPLERIICLLFGVLTGELGYLVILGVCSNPQWLKDLSNVFRCIFGFASIITFLVAIRYVIERRDRARWKRRSTWFICGTLVSLGVAFLCAYYADPNHFVIVPTQNGLAWYFAEQPLAFKMDTTANVQFGTVAITTIEWFTHALGCALKALFAFGAAVLSAMIIVWDILAGKNEDELAAQAEKLSRAVASEAKEAELRDEQLIKDSYKRSKVFFYVMDSLAFVSWTAVLGVVLPHGLLGTSSQEWCGMLAFFAGMYALAAVLRLSYARTTLGSLSSWKMAQKVVV
jgi:uncharacterized membrane protein required for colicin V production